MGGVVVALTTVLLGATAIWRALGERGLSGHGPGAHGPGGHGPRARMFLHSGHAPDRARTPARGQKWKR
jgi:hypothetical protein